MDIDTQATAQQSEQQSEQPTKTSYDWGEYSDNPAVTGKTPHQLANEHINLQSKIGEQGERLGRSIELPKSDDDQGWEKTFEKWGTPKDAKDYDLKAPQGADWWDDNAQNDIRGFLHATGANQHQAQKFMQAYQAHNEDRNQKAQHLVGELKTDLKGQWGHEYDSNMTHVQRAVAQMGIDGDGLNALAKAGAGSTKMLGVLATVGKSLAEDGGGMGQSVPSLSPKEAQSAYDQLLIEKGNVIGNSAHPEHSAVKAQAKRLVDLKNRR